MNITLKQLEAFLWVVKLGSFRKAAERLNTTQPNISARIKALEKSLGVKLLDRHSGSVRLTKIGENLLPHAIKVLNTTDELVGMAGRPDLHEQHVRIGVTEIVAQTWLRDFMVSVYDEYPNIGLELTVDISFNLRKMLHSGSLDLVIHNGPFNRRMSGSRDLGSYPWIWVASPHIVQGDKIQNAGLFQKHTILTPSRNTGIFEDIRSHFSFDEKSIKKLAPSSNLSVILQMAIDGLGIAILPKTFVSAEIENGTLVQLNYDWVPNALDFRVRYDAKLSSIIIKKLANICVETAMKKDK